MRFAVVSMFLLAVPAVATAEAAPTAVPKVTDRNDPNFVVCRRESVTGSLAQTKKICMTRAEWAARTRNSQEGAQAMQNSGHVNSCGSGQPGVC